MFEKGQKVFAVMTGYGRTREEEWTVDKVGREWAYSGRHRFGKETGNIDGYGGGRVYTSRAAYEHEKEMDALWKVIRDEASNYYRPRHLTFRDLLDLKSILISD